MNAHDTLLQINTLMQAYLGPKPEERTLAVDTSPEPTVPAGHEGKDLWHFGIWTVVLGTGDSAACEFTVPDGWTGNADLSCDQGAAQGFIGVTFDTTPVGAAQNLGSLAPGRHVITVVGTKANPFTPKSIANIVLTHS